MSKPSGQPENAASAPPVSPAHPAKLPSGPAAPSPPSAAPLAAEGDVSVPPPPHAAVASPDPPLDSQPSTPVARHAEQDKWPRGPANPQRPLGPSLLTQALATARAVSSSGESEAEAEQPQDADRQQQPRRRPSSQDLSPSPSTTTTPAATRLQSQHVPPALSPFQHAADPLEGSPYHSDGDSLTPRGSPRTSTMASTVASPPAPLTPRFSTAELCRSPSQDVLDFDRQVGDVVRDAGEYAVQPNGWPIPTDMDSSNGSGHPNPHHPHHLHRTQTLATAPRDPGGAGPAPMAEAKPPRGSSAPDEVAVSDSSAHSRPRKLEHRLSIGPEKAWSIGAGELSSNQDGQVEKSITEVLAGVEPNARSRKASHHLRFFKEGLPEEKGKRKDQRPLPRAQSRERLSPTTEEPPDTHLLTPAGEEAKAAASDSPALPLPHSVQPAPCATQSPSAPPKSEPSPADYYALPQPRDNQRAESSREPTAPSIPPPPPPPESPFSLPDHEPRRSDIVSKTREDWRSRDRNETRPRPEVSEIGEDADDSGEEKISSAVFLPHPRLEDGAEARISRPPRLAPGSRTMARPDDFHPWLVKADEPETDEQEARHGDYDEAEPKAADLEASPAPAAREPSSRVAAATTTTTTTTTADVVDLAADEPPDSAYQDYEGHVHAHQLAPKEPLEAIELIPYKHQVGGHTTLWRFSKRAVCKKLNNRENEFYESVEKYHRDLLAFLPRYIGVLNVTFQKRSRRRSTAKRDDHAAPAREQQGDAGAATIKTAADESSGQGEKALLLDMPKMQNGHHHRVISQSLQSTQMPVPTVTFVDNQHILPRNLLQPPQAGFPAGFSAGFSAGFTTLPRQQQQQQQQQQQARSTSASLREIGWPKLPEPAAGGGTGRDRPYSSSSATAAAGGISSNLRPSLHERHSNSWGATTINKRLRNEVFNDAFLKQPIAIQRHRKGHHHRSLPHRSSLPHSLPPGASTAEPLDVPVVGDSGAATIQGNLPLRPRSASAAPRQEDQALPAGIRHHIRRPTDRCERRGVAGGKGEKGGAAADGDLKDVTGTSAPEPEIPVESPPEPRRKRRHSGSALRRKPKDVRESRGNLVYFEEADEAGYKGEGTSDRRGIPESHNELSASAERDNDDDDDDDEEDVDDVLPASEPFFLGGSRPSVSETTVTGANHDSSTALVPPRTMSPAPEFKIPRPVNPKEAQTQRDSWVEYFLLLEDLTAGMKRPCIMDLKMGTRQYGVDANPGKQRSQRGKCVKTTSRQLGVRVCGLQVWDVQTQTYVFKDKYYGRDLQAGREFQDALTRFLYDGADRSSILRHIPTVLQKIDELEVIISRLGGYRFYAASLLMFYDSAAAETTSAAAAAAGAASASASAYDTAEDSATTATDFATDNEEPLSAHPYHSHHHSRRRRRDKREIDFKMADFANCITAGDHTRDKPCPPRHPDEPDRGFLRGLQSLRRYFLKIQRDTRAELGLGSRLRDGMPHVGDGDDDFDLDLSDGEGAVSE